MPIPHGLIGGRYRAIRVLGHGAGGPVYLARDEAAAGRPVAVKTLRAPPSGSATTGQVLHEFLLLRGLNHPCLARVYDLLPSNVPGEFLLAQEYVPGSTFLEACRGAGIDTVVDLSIQVLRALQFVHSHDVIHFDVKPSNILVARIGEGIETSPHAGLKLIDFGLAGEGTLGPGMVVKGTVEYMAPEMAAGQPVDRRADLYSFGATLYHVLAGQVPFTGGSAADILKQHLRAEPLPLRQRNPEIPVDVERVVRRLMSKEPRDRYPSANAAIEDLGRSRALVSVEPTSIAESYVLSAGFLGREPEMREIEGWISDLSAGHPAPAAVCITGEGGIGKSRLAAEARARFLLAEIPFLVGRCTPDRGTPFQPFVELIRQAVSLPSRFGARGGENPAGALIERFGPELVKLAPEMPALRAIAPTPPLKPEEERTRLMRGVVRYLMELGRLHPLVACIEDLHWADASTLDMLRLLGRATASDRRTREDLAEESTADSPATPRADGLSIWLTRRPGGGPGDQVSPVLEAFGEGGAVREVVLTPLESDSVRRWVGAMLPGAEVATEVVSRVTAWTGGTPYFVEETIKSWLIRGLLRRDDRVWRLFGEPGADGAPETLTDLIRRRLDDLPPDLSGVLEAAALFDRPSSADSIAVVAGLTLEVTLDRVRGLIQAGLLRRETSPTGPVLSLRHALLRDVVMGRLDEARRRGIHLRIGEHLEPSEEEPSGERLDELAHHFIRAGCAAKAARYAIPAGDRAMKIGATERALRLYEGVRPFLPPSPREAVLDLDEKTAGALVRLARLDEARERYERLLHDSEGILSSDRRSEFCLRMAYILSSKRDFEGAVAEADRGLQVLGARGSEAKILSLLHERCFCNIHRGRFDDALRDGHAALTGYERLQDRAGISRACSSLGTAHSHLGEHGRAIEMLSRAAELDESSEDLTARPRTLCNLGFAYANAGAYGRAMKCMEEAVGRARRVEDVTLLDGVLYNLGGCLFHNGQSERAAACFRESLGLREAMGNFDGASENMCHLASLALVNAEYRRALKWAQRAMVMARRGRISASVAKALNRRANVLMLLTDLESARQDALEAEARCETPRYGTEKTHAFELLGLIETEQGRTDDAFVWLKRAEELSAAANDRDAQTRVAVARARALIEVGSFVEAREEMRKVEEALRTVRLNRLLSEALLTEGLIELLRPGGDPAVALDPLHRAEAALRDWPAPEVEWQVWHALGQARHSLGEHTAAASLYRKAMDKIVEIGRSVSPEYRDRYFAGRRRRRVLEDASRLQTEIGEGISR